MKAGHAALVGRGAGRGGLVGRGSEALVAQEALDARGVLDEGAELYPAPTGGTVLDVDAEGQAHELGPSEVAAAGADHEGALPGYNPRYHGRPSYHPILARWAEVDAVVGARLRPGDTSLGEQPHASEPKQPSGTCGIHTSATVTATGARQG